MIIQNKSFYHCIEGGGGGGTSVGGWELGGAVDDGIPPGGGGGGIPGGLCGEAPAPKIKDHINNKK